MAHGPHFSRHGSLAPRFRPVHIEKYGSVPEATNRIDEKLPELTAL